MEFIGNRDTIQILLDNFSTDFKNGKYTKKIDYNIWRQLNKATQITVSYNNKNIKVQLKLPNDTCYAGFFSCNDCGFGQFLMDNYLKEEKTVEEKNSFKYSDGRKLEYDNGEIYAKTGVSSGESLVEVRTASVSDSITYTTSTTSNGYLDSNTITTGTTWTYPPNSVTVDGEKFVTKEEFYKILNKEKEEDNMNTKKFFGSSFDFGSCGDTVRMSMYGLAVKNQNGEWVSYDTINEEIVNVEIFNFAEGGKWFYKMPVAVDDVAIGNLIIHAKKPCYVVGFNENTLNPIVVDIYNMEQKEILLLRNAFGFNYATKVVSLFDGLNMQQPSAKNPFGNMWMFALMGDGKSDDMLPLMMMMQGSCGNMNSMLMYMMMSKDDSKIDPFMLMMLNGGMNMCGENK